MRDKIVTKKVANKSFVNVVNFRYLGAVLTNQNGTHEKGVRILLNLGNAC